MGMPITVCIADKDASKKDFEKIFDYFTYVDEKFSPFKKTSELSKINDGSLEYNDLSDDMKEVLELSKKTSEETSGFFDIKKTDGSINTSGLVKGWAIYNASKILKDLGFENFYIDAGGDIQTNGKNEYGENWSIGIKDPFDKSRGKIVKKIYLKNDEGVATSGTYERGQHIWNPSGLKNTPILDIVSITIIGKNIYEADRFATAAFAMGKNGINFIENLEGFEGYMIDKDGVATYTSGFEKYLS
jgi:thiamine biosynthesis lipoprotein